MVSFNAEEEDGTPYYNGVLSYNGESLDTDGDGKISRDEMVYFYDYNALLAYVTEYGNLYKQFLRYGEDGYLDLSDINKALNFFALQYYEIKNPYSVIKAYEEYKAKYEAATSAGQKNTWKKRMDNEYSKLEEMFKEFPVTGSFDSNGNPVASTPIYVLKGNSSKDPFEKNSPQTARKLSNYLKTYYPSYSISEMIADEKDAGCIMPVTAKPIFRCSIEYTLDSDGTLQVKIPSNSIMFDETKYTLNDIKVLEAMGAARYENFNFDGSTEVVDNEYSYAFFPDGSGMIVNFSEHKNATLHRPLYGVDYAYSTLETDVNYLEAASIPVFGVVTKARANASTLNKLTQLGLIDGSVTEITSGFVAIIDEGSALADIHIDAGGTTHKFGTTYISISPYPQDTFDLSTSISVGDAATSYTKVSDSKYTGSYVMKINLLSDPVCQPLVDLANEGLEEGVDKYNTYVASYVGMATCYRDYLREGGVLTALNTASQNMPLYIEALGSMDYVKKILTFPVNSSKELTTFEDIAVMYGELSNVVKTLKDKSTEYANLANETDDIDQKVNYQNKSVEFAELAEEFKDLSIKNVNFKLTGFANDGISYTYPTKLKWERVCGGKSGFNQLVATADEQGFGVYPDFDFMYIVNTSMFDGVGTNGYISRHIDNRYAAKQVFDPTWGMYYNSFEAVISTKVLSGLFEKFESRYSKYNWKYISLSTFGDTLNSNFDEDEPINRDQSMNYVTEVLANAKNKGYSIMVDGGNAYTYGYVDHIVNLAIDSSHHSYCSYTVPFIGMVLHGYVSYTGSPINYSGDDNYDLLRSIESGAALLYILCYTNTEFMKENDDANLYYSVDYEHWYTNVLDNYNKLNNAIGKLQNYQIIDHKEMIAEKAVNSAQAKANLIKVYTEYIGIVDRYINAKIDAAYEEMKAGKDYVGKGIYLDVDVRALEAEFEAIVNSEVDFAELAANDDSLPTLEELVAEIKVLRGHKEDGTLVSVKTEEEIAELNAYHTERSVYDFYTDSFAEDGADYDETVYTAVNHNVVKVTYGKTLEDGTVDTVSFLLNYNIYAVNVRLDDGKVITLGRYEYQEI